MEDDMLNDRVMNDPLDSLSVDELLLRLVSRMIDSGYQGDWIQKPLHPEHDLYETWGSGEVIAKVYGDKYSNICKFADSPQMWMVIDAVNAVPRLLRHIMQLQDKIKSMQVLSEN